MRQGGFKPKSHSSGTYWVRANANTGNENSKEVETLDDYASPYALKVARNIGRIIGVVISAFLIWIGFKNKITGSED
jgi:hypothetical protein